MEMEDQCSILHVHTETRYLKDTKDDSTQCGMQLLTCPESPEQVSEISQSFTT